MSITQLAEHKSQGRKIVMLTCYDYTSARIVADSEVDLLLVGDSAAMVIHGHDTTLPINVDTIAMHVAAVARGAGSKVIIADMPFLSFRKSLSDVMTAVEKLMQAGAHGIKLEGIEGNQELIKHIVASGVPVMGHLGLTPQSFHQLGGFRVQGKTETEQQTLLEQASQTEVAGCFALVLECIPAALAASITRRLKIPTIGIGAGPDTDGQVLVMQDLLGMTAEFNPRFVRRYLDGHGLILDAFNRFSADVQSGDFPAPGESYPS